jgi:hypothetical protein
MVRSRRSRNKIASGAVITNYGFSSRSLLFLKDLKRKVMIAVAEERDNRYGNSLSNMCK